jgi:hypothetical protein
MTPWWNGQTSNWIGVIVGTSCGVLGGVIGTLAGIFAPRGKLKWLVFGSMVLALLAGVVSLAVGIVALCAQQPYAVWYPLILVGGILTLAPGGLTPVVYRAYRQAGARRLEAAELRRS